MGWLAGGPAKMAYGDDIGRHGFLYSGGSYTTIDDPSATNGTYAQGINASGQITGYRARSQGITTTPVATMAFSIAGAATPPSTIMSINASGHITGWYGGRQWHSWLPC
jgi:hypothetical protein